MTYILIYWILASYSVGGGFTTGQATFADQTSCDGALTKIKDDWASKTPNGNTYGVAGGECVASATVPAVKLP